MIPIEFDKSHKIDNTDKYLLRLLTWLSCFEQKEKEKSKEASERNRKDSASSNDGNRKDSLSSSFGKDDDLEQELVSRKDSNVSNLSNTSTASEVSESSTEGASRKTSHTSATSDTLEDKDHSVERVLYDSACDDAALKARFKDKWGIELKASFNPRRAKPITTDLPRGIEKITPYGVPICLAGYELDYQGIRYEREKFIYAAPRQDDGTAVCVGCTERADCCNRSTQFGRTITVSFDTLPHIDPNEPPMAKRFKAIMSRRPSVERMIKRLKCDLGDERLSKRGNESFQAYLDKTMIAYHLLIRHLH